MAVATVTLLPGDGLPPTRSVQLTNASGHVTLEFAPDGIWMILSHQRRPIAPEKLNAFLMVWYANQNTKKDNE